MCMWSAATPAIGSSDEAIMVAAPGRADDFHPIYSSSTRPPWTQYYDAFATSFAADSMATYLSPA
jgi:hypothetical protein